MYLLNSHYAKYIIQYIINIIHLEQILIIDRDLILIYLVNIQFYLLVLTLFSKSNNSKLNKNLIFIIIL